MQLVTRTGLTTLTGTARIARRAVLAGAAFMLAATMGATSALAQIKVWHHGGRGKDERAIVEKLIATWNERNPNDKAELVLLPEGAYSEQVQAAALAGKLPDLLDFDGPNYANYVWAGYLLPLNGLVSDAVLGNALPSIIAQGTYAPDGKVYSLGQFDSGLALWASKSALTKAGLRIPAGPADAWTLAEFEDALSKLKAAGYPTPLDLKLNYGKGEWFTYGFSPILQSFGGDLIDRKTWRAKGTLDGAASVQAMTTFQGWIKKGFVVPASAGDDAFYGKKTAALALVGHWMYASHRDALKDDLLLLPIPKFGAKAATGMGSWCWGIPKTAKDPKKAAKLLEFLMSDEAVKATVDAIGGVPGTKSVAASAPLFAKGGALSLYVEQLNTIAVSRPAHPGYPAITGAFAEAVSEVVSGADPKAALTKAAAAIDRDIEDNQGYPPFSTK